MMGSNISTPACLIANVENFPSCHFSDFGSLSKENVYENNRLVSPFLFPAVCFWGFNTPVIACVNLIDLL